MKFNSALLLGAIAASSLLACATAKPPAELVSAREAYSRAQGGPANQLLPAELYSDRHYLDAAEAANKDDPTSTKTRDLSYVALRKIETTETKARTQSLLAQRDATEASTNARVRGELKQSREKLSESDKQIALNQSQLAQTREQLDQEKAARAAAEEQLHDAVSQIAKIKEEDRGTVITLSGSVLFASGKSELLPSASAKLGPVADAIKQMKNRTLVVEGFTDSRGSAELNQSLSERRAQSVRQFLVDHGVDANRVTSEGRGPSQPVAENTSAEGRANNRRVEIVLQHNVNEPAPSGVGGSSAPAKP